MFLGLGGILEISAQTSPPSAFLKVNRLFVEILCKERFFGTGILIGKDPQMAYVITSAHVISQAPPQIGCYEEDSVSLRFQQVGDIIPATRVLPLNHNKTVDDFDFQVLKVPFTEHPRLQEALESMQWDVLGDRQTLGPFSPKLNVLGNRRGETIKFRQEEATFERGGPSQITVNSVDIQDGHSGGGLLNEEWLLLAMIAQDLGNQAKAVPMASILEVIRSEDPSIPILLTQPVPPIAGSDWLDHTTQWYLTPQVMFFQIKWQNPSEQNFNNVFFDTYGLQVEYIRHLSDQLRQWSWQAGVGMHQIRKHGRICDEILNPECVDDFSDSDKGRIIKAEVGLGYYIQGLPIPLIASLNSHWMTGTVNEAPTAEEVVWPSGDFSMILGGIQVLSNFRLWGQAFSVGYQRNLSFLGSYKTGEYWERLNNTSINYQSLFVSFRIKPSALLPAAR